MGRRLSRSARGVAPRARAQDARPARAAADRKRHGDGHLAGGPPRGQPRSLSGTGFPSGPRHRRETDDAVRRPLRLRAGRRSTRGRGLRGENAPDQPRAHARRRGDDLPHPGRLVAYPAHPGRARRGGYLRRPDPAVERYRGSPRPDPGPGAGYPGLNASGCTGGRVKSIASAIRGALPLAVVLGVPGMLGGLPGASTPSSAAVENWRWKSGGPYGAPVRDVIVDPARPGRLWAVTASAIFETDNEGARWHAISGGLTNPWGSCWVTCLAVDPLSDRLVAGTRLSGLFASVDRGRNWSSLQAAFEMSVETISAISIDPRDSGKLLVGTNAGLFASDDGGESFRRAAIPNTGEVPGKVLALERLPDNADRVFVSVDRAGLFSSADGGATWTAAGDGLITAPACLAFEAGNPSHLWAGGAGGLHRWDGLTSRWVPVGSGLPRDVEITSL